MRKKLLALFFVIILTLTLATSTASLVVAKTSSTVFLGGFPVVLDIENNGVIVVDKNANNDNFSFSVISNNVLSNGDTIIELNGQKIECVKDISTSLENCTDSLPVSVKYIRNNNVCENKIYPVKEICSGKYKLNYRLKDQISGLGTVTFITKDKKLASLGHNITDNESIANINCRAGKIFTCKLTGVEKGKAGKAGRLVGRCENCQQPIGSLACNYEVGLYGNYSNSVMGLRSYETASKDEIKIGTAQIATTIKEKLEYFNVEIVRTFNQSKSAQKSMVIKIVDENLINYTGGIVQGMSGSPILQNDKIVGAVTHVFTNDATMGYGVYIDWMMQAVNQVA